MVAVQVGNEGGGHAVGRQAGGGEAALDARAGVEEEYPVPDHHGGRRPRCLGYGPWRAGSEHDDDRALRRGRWCAGRDAGYSALPPQGCREPEQGRKVE